MVLVYVFFLNGDQLQVSAGMYIQLTISRIMKTFTKPLTNEDRVVLNMNAVTSPHYSTPTALCTFMDCQL